VQPFEMTCVLWQPEHREGAVGGTLRYQPDTGLSADIVGSLDPDQPLATVFEPPTDNDRAALADLTANADSDAPNRDPGRLVPVLLGVVQGQPITLLNVRRQDATRAVPGHAHERLTPEVLIRGWHGGVPRLV
jgi:hypothetical protein